MELAESKFDGGQIIWLPQEQQKTRGLDYRVGFTAGYSETAIVVLTLGGLGAVAVLKSFLTEFSKEAGKAAFHGSMALLKKIWERQAKRSYRLHSVANLHLELGEDTLILRFQISISSEEKDQSAAIKDALDKQLAVLATQTPKILEDIERFKLGTEKAVDITQGRGKVHIVVLYGDGPMIEPYDQSHRYYVDAAVD